MTTNNRRSALVMALWIASLLVLVGVESAQACTEDGDIATFRTCITGSGSSCTVPTGTHSVCAVLTIGNSNLALITGGSSDPDDTVLQRGDGYVSQMMSWSSAAQGLVIEYLTFDGNRWAFGSPPMSGHTTAPNLSCLDEQSTTYYDLNLYGATIATVQHVNFVNSPLHALYLRGSVHGVGTASTVSYSNFGDLGDSTKATRASGVLLGAQYGGSYYNNMYYSGTTGLTIFQGTNQIAYGNYLFSNFYEQGGNQGGVLFTYIDSGGTTVASNEMDGNFWTSPATGTINGCPTYGVGTPSGVEAHGDSQYFYNNEIKNNTAYGMAVGVGLNDTSNIHISSSNPFDANDPAKYIHDNYYQGISLSTVDNVTLDAVRVCNTGYASTPSTPHTQGAPFGNYGIYFDTTSGTGFVNGATLSNNYPGDIYLDSYSSSNVTNTSPGTPSSCPSF